MAALRTLISYLENLYIKIYLQNFSILAISMHNGSFEDILVQTSGGFDDIFVQTNGGIDDILASTYRKIFTIPEHSSHHKCRCLCYMQPALIKLNFLLKNLPKSAYSKHVPKLTNELNLLPKNTESQPNINKSLFTKQLYKQFAKK